jgi:hypothetical protein
MKARVIETNEIVELQEDTNSDYFTKDGLHFKGFELDFNVEQPDYWEKLKHQYAGMFLQGMIIGKPFTRDYVEDAYKYATALINKLKEESKCEK